MDTLTIKGVARRVDGDYACDLAAMFDVSSDEALTNQEAHLVKRLSGSRGNEIVEAFIAGDTDVRMALAIIVLGRHGKDADEASFWAAKIGATTFTLGADDLEEPADPPTTEGEPLSSPSNDGGDSSSTTSDGPPENVLSLTGTRG